MISDKCLSFLGWWAVFGKMFVNSFTRFKALLSNLQKSVKISDEGSRIKIVTAIALDRLTSLKCF